MEAYAYENINGVLIYVDPVAFFPEWDGFWQHLTDEQKEFLAAEARRRDRKCALIRSIRAMYNAGERFEAAEIVKREFGGDLK